MDRWRSPWIVAREKPRAAASRILTTLLQTSLVREALRDAVRHGDRFYNNDSVHPTWPSSPAGTVLSYSPGDSPVCVGRYSAINEQAYVMRGSMHRTDHVSSWCFSDDGVPKESQFTTKGPIVIGSDVLICFDALILSGVTIGHGAVVAARAVVTKDVPPYAVVAGVPASIIGYRFDQSVIEALLRIQWWDWSRDKIMAHVWQFASPDVTGFVARHDPDRSMQTCDDCTRIPS
jgi:acetyltransferase-like isoleucine patch superfamily enzyme